MRPPAVEHIANAWAVAGTVVVSGHEVPHEVPNEVPYTVSGSGPRQPNAAWTTSAGALFGDMALDESQRLPAGPVRAAAIAAARTLRPFVRALDPVCMLDSTGLSTQLHAPQLLAALPKAVAELRDLHPRAAVVLRSLDARHSAPLLAWVRDNGWCLVPTRRVWFQPAAEPQLWRRRNVQHDLKLSRRVLAMPNTGWRMLSAADAPEAAALYAQLYLGKYSRHNPHFTANWLADGLTSGWLSGEGLHHNGRMVAVLAGWCRAGYATYPVFGYDLHAPAELGLYRMLSLRALERARDAGDVLHASAGADAFKASRGGIPETEWLAVFDAPLPVWQRAAWRTLAAVASAAAHHVFPQSTEVAA
jgi:hypothetical protein